MGRFAYYTAVTVRVPRAVFTGARMGIDGNDGRRPGRVAENWGRQDRIRAGAVSGPWRSTPKADDAPNVTRAAPPASTPPLTGSPSGAQKQPPPDRQDAPRRHEGERQPLPYRPRLVGVWIAVAVGVSVALATVGAALVFRNSAMDEAPLESAVAPPPAQPVVQPEAVAVVPVPDEAVVDEEIAAAPAAVPGAVRLRVGPNLAEADRDALAAALDAAGYGPVQVEVLPFPIAASRVGYYWPEDAAAAEALAAFVRGAVQTQGIELGIRDYSRLLQDAAPGRLDVWIQE